MEHTVFVKEQKKELQWSNNSFYHFRKLFASLNSKIDWYTFLPEYTRYKWIKGGFFAISIVDTGAKNEENLI